MDISVALKWAVIAALIVGALSSLGIYLDRKNTGVTLKEEIRKFGESDVFKFYASWIVLPAWITFWVVFVVVLWKLHDP